MWTRNDIPKPSNRGAMREDAIFKIMSMTKPVVGR